MTDTLPNVVNVADVEEVADMDDSRWGHAYKVLTPAMGRHNLGVNQTRLPPGKTSCPFHHHLREDEVFFVLSGRGMLRYGEDLREIRAGDCISCPAGSGKAHQIANPFDEDLVYLAIGPNDPHEVCVYPDSGKVLVRGLRRIGFFAPADYMAGEPTEPRIFDLIRDQQKG